MYSLARQAAMRPLIRTVRPIRNARFASEGRQSGEAIQNDRNAGKSAVTKGAKRDPELYVLFSIMCGAFGLAGWYFSSSPTSATSENAVSKIPDSEPWRTGGQGKYQYYPGGDRKAAPKDAPSALHVTIVPDVTLPKHLHDKYNKYGKDGYP